jgi:hypothetical protein
VHTADNLLADCDYGYPAVSSCLDTAAAISPGRDHCRWHPAVIQGNNYPALEASGQARLLANFKNRLTHATILGYFIA